LLFAFFTVLYATSQKDISKARVFEQSIRKAFHTSLDFGGVPGGQASFDEYGKLIPPPIELYPAQDSTPADLEEKVNKILEKAASKGDAAKVTVRHDALGVEITMATASLFPSGSDALTEAGMRELGKIGLILKASNKNLIVQGHTDNEGVHTPRFQNNWDLSAARATRIVRYLEMRHKISPSKMIAVAYADQRPVASNETEEGRAKNRRIEIMLVTGQSPL
jgi:chemotaxis protein MotB